MRILLTVAYLLLGPLVALMTVLGADPLDRGGRGSSWRRATRRGDMEALKRLS